MWKLFLAGSILPLAFAPLDCSPCAIIALWILFNSWLHTSTPKSAFLHGWVFGLGFFGIGISWVFISIHRFGNTNMLLAAIITAFCIAFLALFPALQGGIIKKLLPNHPKTCLLIAYPSSWVLMEYLRCLLFTGFPWLYLGYSQLNTPLIGFAPIIGVYGVSFLLCVSVGLLIFVCNNKLSGFSEQICQAFFAIRTLLPFSHMREKLSEGLMKVARCMKNLTQEWGRFCAILTLFAIWTFGYFLQAIPWTTSTGQSNTVCLVQGNLMPNDKFLLSKPLQAIAQMYLVPTQQHLNNNFIIWPENSIPIPLPYAQTVIDSLDKLATSNNLTLLVGLPVEANKNPAQYYNSLIAVGKGQGIYHKKHLVPFGEYLPLEKWLRGTINFFSLPMSSFTPGPQQQAQIQTPLSKLLPFICYEIAYPADVRQELLEHPSDALLTISEDGWFGDSWGPHQHLAIARMRAIENGRFVIRSTTSGISAIIDEKGTILQQSPQFQPYVLVGKFVNFTGITPWTKYGQEPILLFCALLLMVSSLPLTLQIYSHIHMARLWKQK